MYPRRCDESDRALVGTQRLTPKNHRRTIFDEEFSRQIIARGKIEDTEVLHKFLHKTKQPLMQDWLVTIGRNIAMRLPVKWGLKMMWAQVFKPKTKDWAKSRKAIEDYIIEQDAHHRHALKLDAPKAKTTAHQAKITRQPNSHAVPH